MATTTISLDGWQLGPPDISYVVQLDPPLRVEGQVVTEEGSPAGGTHVIISEPVEVPPDNRAPPDEQERSWRSVSEMQTDGDGRFRVDTLKDGLYQFLALHPVLGRLLVEREVGSGSIVLRLRAPKRARGVVVRDGLPVSGLRVWTAPDLRQYLATDDAMSVVGGETVTGPDGQFLLALPPKGVAQVVVGTPEFGFVRRTIGPAENLPPLTDLGTIDLAGAIRLFIRLDGWSACDLHAAGPLGSSGLSVLAAATIGPGLRRFDLPEAGRWLLSLRCGTSERAVDPPVVDVVPGTRETVAEVRVVLPG